MADTNVRPSAVQKFLRTPGPRLEPEVEEAREGYHNARPQSREAMMLDVMLKNGTIQSFPYAWLSRVRFEPGDTLVLRFGRDVVTIEGRNLKRLREIIAEHRRRSVQEGTEAEDGLKPENMAHIERIEIKEGDDNL